MSTTRHTFLQECLYDLDEQLKLLGSKLIILNGDPLECLKQVCSKWDVSLITMQKEIGPYARKRDLNVFKWGQESGIQIHQGWDQLLYPMDDLIKRSPKTMTSMVSLISELGEPKKKLPKPDTIPSPNFNLLSPMNSFTKRTGLKELKFKGGESNALIRMKTALNDAKWVATFEKPETSPNSLEPSTTVLSPYLAMGCISPRQMWHEINEKIKAYRGKNTQPPASLLGQLYWRELFYINSWVTPNFHLMNGNPNCKQIDWDDNDAYLDAWTNSKTGFPFIDAIMTQLRTDGWIHHLARHAVACFLTRGDLYQSWEKGAQVFEKYLLDGDYALNNANWQWLSCSNFFYQYYRVYSPIKFGQKTDPKGLYIRKWLPKLALYPDKYIYEPWNAPKDVQTNAKCVVGVDYPFPIVDHKEASSLNMTRMKAAYANQGIKTNPSKKRKRIVVN
jgi:cryptochrome